MATIAEALAIAVRHHQAGRLQAAEQTYRQILLVEPQQVDAIHLLGLVCHATGRREMSIDLISRALLLRPDFAEAHYNLGKVLQDEGRTDEAVASYRQAVRLKPDYAEAYYNLGHALQRRGQWEEAAANYRQAIALKPDYAKAHINLGNVLLEQGRPDEAVGIFETAVRLEPQTAKAHVNLASALRQLGKLDEAVLRGEHAMHLDPANAEARNNLGAAFLDQGRLEDAVASFREAIRLKPHYPRAWTNLGAALLDLGRSEDAQASFQEAIRLKPDCAEAHVAMAIARLLLGDFEQAWPEYEWRQRELDRSLLPFQRPHWDGSFLAGRTILLHAEQGLGDTLQFIRYAALVGRGGGRVVVACPKPLHRLLCSCRSIDQLVDAVSPQLAFDVHAPLLSLPGILHTTLSTVPADIPYLFADPELTDRWRRDLSSIAGFRIGIAWQGNPKFRGDRSRSIPLRCFEPLARFEAVRLVSLQKGAGAADLCGVVDRFPVEDLGSSVDEASGAFMDTAAVMKNLDLVISADTAIAHLAGALGVPVWVVLRSVPDWRWMLDRSDSPWYPTMRLFRQKKLGDWIGAFDEVQMALGQRLRS